MNAGPGNAKILLKDICQTSLELLLVSKGYKQGGWRCEKCQFVDSDITDKCPNCSGKVSQVDVIEEIIEFAERTGSVEK